MHLSNSKPFSDDTALIPKFVEVVSIYAGVLYFKSKMLKDFWGFNFNKNDLRIVKKNEMILPLHGLQAISTFGSIKKEARKIEMAISLPNVKQYRKRDANFL